MLFQVKRPTTIPILGDIFKQQQKQLANKSNCDCETPEEKESDIYKIWCPGRLVYDAVP